MPLIAPAATVLHTRVLQLPTHEPIQLVDITRRIAIIVSQAGLHNGLVQVFSRHTTAAVRIQEDEPLLLEDLRQFLSRVAPAEAAYGHNDFRVRTQHMHPDERPNGHAHCLQLLLGSSESVPVVDGQLQLGEWQRLFLVELDGPRPERKLLVQVMGQAAPSAADRAPLDFPLPLARHAVTAQIGLRRTPWPHLGRPLP
jgi:secondary thiamine-phosphate synthase enzyme